MPPPGNDDNLSEELHRRINPHLEELGIEGFVMMGYARQPNGRMVRVVAINDGRDAAIGDGLRPAILFAMGWSGNLARPAPPSTNENDHSG